MTFQHVDAVIAFVAVMLAASLVVTAGTQFVISLLGLRGANLRRSLADLFQTASHDRDAKRHANVIARRVLRHPLISGSAFSRFCVRLDELPFLPADAAGKLRWAGSGIPLQPWLFGALFGSIIWPIALRIINRLSSLDFCEYSQFVARYVPVLNLCQHPWRSGAIVGAIIGGLLSRWRLATSIGADDLVAVLEKLSSPADGTLPDPAQRAMLVIAGEARSGPRAKTSPVSAQMERIFQDSHDDSDGGVAVAVEKVVAQVSGHTEPRVEGLTFWFDQAMDRASQRFTLQVRVITVVLSLVLVSAAHLDAIRVFQTFSSDAQVRAQLAGSADAIVKQAEGLPRARDGAGSAAARESVRSVVPDVYRTAMLAVLESAPVIPEQTKPKSRRPSRSTATPPSVAAESESGGSPAAPNEIPIATAVPPVVGEDGQVPPVTAQSLPEASAKGKGKRTAARAKPKSTKEQEKAGAAPGEDKATIEAKAKAAKVLETTPGFASREDAALWLRATLDGDPSVENLAAAYQQEVNSELAGDADKLVDHSASIKRELARSEFKVLPEKWPGWKPNEHELPGLLVALVFLSLGAPFCYNMLKVIVSLRPVTTMKQDKRASF